MKLVKSRIILLLLMGIVALIVISGIRPAKSPKPSPSSTPNASIAPTAALLDVPTIPNKSKLPTSFTFAPSIASIPIPPTLPSYRAYVKKLPLAKIATILGFKTPPNPKDVVVELFDPKVGRLKINQDTGHVFFTSSRDASKTTTPLTAEEVTAITLKLLKDLELSTAELQPAISKIDYFMTNGYNLAPGNVARANLITSSIVLTLNDLPLYLNAPGLLSAEISIDSDKSIRSLSVFAPPNLTEEERLSIYTNEEARLALAAGQGSLLKASPTGFTEFTVDPTFSQATITKVALIYTQIKGEVIPVYEMSGKALDDETNREFEVVYLVSAAKE